MNPLQLGLIVSTLLSGLAWGLPMLSGQLTYPNFALAMIATAAMASLLILLLIPEPRRRAAAVRLMAVWLGLSLAIGICEILALVWPTDSLADNPWYISTGQALAADDDLPWMRPPGLRWTGSSRGDLAMETNSPDPAARTITFQTDFEGFRNSRDLSKAEIIFIGDSFTEAGNVLEEETFVWRSGESLGAVARNMGVAGFAPPSELVALQKFGLRCDPRAVVWQVAETNDLDDALFFIQWQQSGRPNVLPGFTSAKPSQIEGWRRRSPSHLLFEMCQQQQQPWPFCGDFIDRDIQKHTVRFEMSFPPDVNQHPGWPVIEYSLTAGAEMLKERQIQLIVIMIPRKLRVLGPYTDIHEMELNTPSGPLTVKHTLPDGWDGDPQGRLGTKLQTLCQRLDLSFIDATTPLAQRASEGDLVYQAMDTHLSPIGHEIVAELLVDALKQE